MHNGRPCRAGRGHRSCVLSMVVHKNLYRTTLFAVSLSFTYLYRYSFFLLLPMFFYSFRYFPVRRELAAVSRMRGPTVRSYLPFAAFLGRPTAPPPSPSPAGTLSPPCTAGRLAGAEFVSRSGDYTPVIACKMKGKTRRISKRASAAVALGLRRVAHEEENCGTSKLGTPIRTRAFDRRLKRGGRGPPTTTTTLLRRTLVPSTLFIFSLRVRCISVSETEERTSDAYGCRMRVYVP